MTFENKNEKQVYFNQVKGFIKEINQEETFCNVVIRVGHENQRDVNFVVKSTEYKDKYTQYKIGDKVTVKFYLTSRSKNGRWYTNANILDIVAD
jgi:hypothetical protein